MKRSIRLLPIILFSIAPYCHLSAACGAAGCPVDVQTVEITHRGDVRLDYTYEYVDQTRARIGRQSASVGEIRGHHDEVSTLSIVQKLAVEAGLTNRLSFQATLPMVHREHRHIHHHHGSDIDDSWNFDGVGDLEILVRYALARDSDGRSRASLIAGGVLPTGRDSAVNSNGDEAEVGILPGKEAYSFILGGSAVKVFSAKTANRRTAQMPVFLSSTYQWNKPGKEEYRMGDVWQANAGVVYPVFPRLGFVFQTNARVNRKDERGETSEEVEKTGGTFIYLTPGLRFGLARNLWGFFHVQLPVYQRVNSIQLTSAANLFGGISYRFNVLE